MIYQFHKNLDIVAAHLTAVFFETGAMLTPTKSQNGTDCGSGGFGGMDDL